MNSILTGAIISAHSAYKRCIRRIIFCLIALPIAMFATLFNGAVIAQTTPAADYWPGPAVSGSWYDTTRDGEGIVLQYLPNGRAIVTWFTYPLVGEPGAQAWFITDLGTVAGNKIKFPVVFQPQGGVFGDAFDPARVRNVVWGSMELEFTDCNTLTMRYEGPAAYGTGVRNMTRLTALDQLNCGGGRSLNASGARAIGGMRSNNGAWYVPSRSGEGWMVEELADNRTLVYWFTYDPQGRQAWTVGVGARSRNSSGNRIEVSENIITSGARFGAAFKATDVVRTRWGSLNLTFSDCNSVDVSYTSTLTGYTGAQRRGTLLTPLAGAACIDGTPTTRVNGVWEEGAAIPAPKQSEHASAVWDNKLYIMGGVGDARGFKRFDPASNIWAALPALPSGRNHHAAFAFDGGIYYSGGAVEGSGDNLTSGFRFDIATNRWETRPEIIGTFGTHAAVLNGRVFIANPDGSLQEYDPTQRITRRLSRALPQRPRDHSQLVAYMGELWLMGGRLPETNTVAIYDPVTAQWRIGPPMTNRRGGFAAAVVGDQIVVAGGEIITAPIRVEPTAEVFGPGADAWALGPNLPVPVHGVTGSVVNGRVYLVGGSTTAGTEDGNTGRMFSIVLKP